MHRVIKSITYNIDNTGSNRKWSEFNLNTEKKGFRIMYLKKISIKNFRCIKDAMIDLNEGLNILIGENNSGKTAILDALRICLSYGQQRRDIYVSVNDFHIDKNDPNAEPGNIELDLYFEIQEDVEAGIYNDFLSVTDDGKGFDPETVKNKGHGLTNMNSRAEDMEAQFELRSAPGKGTEIILSFRPD